MTNRIDHLVYCVKDLNKTIESFKKDWGITASYGGQHLHQGTENALIKIGEQCYLELLAIDKNNTSAAGPKWMGIDLITQSRMTRWCLASTDINSESNALGEFDSSLNELIEGQRKTNNNQVLKWKMTRPGHEPKISLAPFLIDWSQSEGHPCDKLNQQVSLQSIRLFDPNPNKYFDLFKDLNLDLDLSSSNQTKIEIELLTPKGLKTLY